jgi:hypothetical protein
VPGKLGKKLLSIHRNRKDFKMPVDHLIPDEKDLEGLEVYFEGDFERNPSGLKTLIGEGDVKITVEIQLGVGQIFDWHNNKFGNFEIDVSLESAPYDVRQVLGSNFAVKKFLAEFFKGMVEEEEGR